MKKIIALIFVLVLCIGAGSRPFVKSPHTTKIQGAVCWFYLKGTVGKSGVRMYLTDPNDVFTGQYYYITQGFKKQIELNQTNYDENTGHLILWEYLNGVRMGKFDGYIRFGYRGACTAKYSGTFTSSTGKQFKFNLYDDPASPY